jgi:hypothetical protein
MYKNGCMKNYTKEPNEKIALVFYNISKDRNSKLGNPKNKRATKPN